MPQKKKDILLLVDGNALVHRGFHAIPHLSNKKGEPTNGVYGFVMLFLKALKDLSPKYVVVAFDVDKKTFRDDIYKEYKAGRAKAPDELYAQFPRVKDLVRAFNVPVFEKKGFEADDLIGTLAELGKSDPNLEIYILTGDMDTLQLIDKNVKVYAPKKGLSDTIVYDQKAVYERFGLEPEQLLDYKALRGDASDNIPGVAGIGEKTAIMLLQKYKTLEKLYQAVDSGKTDSIKPRVAQLLAEHKKDAEMSKKLAEIVRDMDIAFDLKAAELADYDEREVYKIFQELEFKSLLDKLPKTRIQNTEYRIQNAGAGKNYELVNTKEKYEKFIAELKKQKEFAIDTETTDLSPVKAKLLGIGFSWKEEQAHYVLAELIDNTLKNILTDEKVKKIGHNIKYDLLVLKRAGVELRGINFDTMIAAYLLNPGARSFDLDTLTFAEFGFRKTKITDLIGPSPLRKGEGQISMSEVPVPRVSDYCCEDTDYTLRLKNRLAGELKNKKLEKLFAEIEMPLIPVLGEMENFGIKIDPKVLGELSEQAEKKIREIEKKIWRIAGKEFNIASPIQLKSILFEKLEIPAENIKRGKTGLSTAAAELEKMRGLHPVIDLISDWREHTKLKNTYLDALPKLINSETGRVHTSFNQTIAATGRLSSSDPNLQNIPIRTEVGRKIRRAFVAHKGFKLLSVDYSQIELRLAAHLSGDEKMIEIFKGGGDIHTATAREIFGTAEVTPDQRRAAKTINFGVLYGLSAYGLTSRIPGVSRANAEEFIDKYFETFKSLAKYLEEITEETRDKGYVTNELGRIRLLPEINSSQFQVRSAAERAAINFPFQSMNADIIKMAMNKLAEENLAAGDDCRLLLQVHDELVFEVRTGKAEEYAKKIAKIMENIYKLRVPLAVEAKQGKNWEEMVRIKL